MTRARRRWIRRKRSTRSQSSLRSLILRARLRGRHRPDGWVVTSVTPYVNIPDYPEMDSLLEELAGFSNMVMVDTAHIARAAGNLRAQNMAALRALASDGIQKGHMALHARNIAILAGATGAQIETVARAIAAEGRVSVDAAREKLAEL